ncbi:MAG TPA: glycoside hydrolase family 127 protein [Sedimentisphaerales bacterium]|nr:glycoside hydrolase family 127 protein [Sedimentisphaerales bacterium]
MDTKGPVVLSIVVGGTVLLLSPACLSAERRAGVDTSGSPHVKVRNTDLDAVRWTEGFWAQRFERCREVTIPALIQVMEKPDNSANFQNFRIVAGLAQGKFFGNDWGDGDCYKLIEAMSAVYRVTHDSSLARRMDEWIEVIGKAQAPDGYISTQIQLTGRPRWQDLHRHELYNMGHLLAAACVHHRATGKDDFLRIARKLGDYLCTVFLPRPRELAHFCFNPSNIMGAVELYRTTGDPKYLRLAQTFVDMRGSAPGGSDQNQAKVPLRQEQEAVGHAVTAAYLWCGAADVYAETGEPALLDALTRLWEDVTERKMYITGGTAALHTGEADRRLLKRGPRDSVHEAFGAPYQLPNRTAYNETCANIAHAMWSRRMLALTGEAKYADMMERVLYNSMLSGIGVEGRDFFYTNPLRRIQGTPLLSNDSVSRWPDTTPASPVHCFCCPPNVARTLAELSGWMYGVSQDAVWVHLYGGSVFDSGGIRLVQETRYPWDGCVTITIERTPGTAWVLQLRIPGWAPGTRLRINDEDSGVEVRPLDYATVTRRWSPGDKVRLDLPMDVVLVEAHPLVEETRDHVAVMRGPVVYCLESADLPESVNLQNVRLPRRPAWQVRHDPDLLRGVTVLETEGAVVPKAGLSSSLYRRLPEGSPEHVKLRLIPYYAWANRGQGDMTVWVPLE